MYKVNSPLVTIKSQLSGILHGILIPWLCKCLARNRTSLYWTSSNIYSLVKNTYLRKYNIHTAFLILYNKNVQIQIYCDFFCGFKLLTCHGHCPFVVWRVLLDTRHELCINYTEAVWWPILNPLPAEYQFLPFEKRSLVSLHFFSGNISSTVIHFYTLIQNKFHQYQNANPSYFVLESTQHNDSFTLLVFIPEETKKKNQPLAKV